MFYIYFHPYILLLSPFRWLPIHPANVYCVPTTCQGGALLESGEICPEAVLPGGIQREVNSEVLGDLTIQPKKSQFFIQFYWIQIFQKR